MGRCPPPHKNSPNPPEMTDAEEREALLQQRIDKLGLKIEGTRLEP